MARTKSQSDSSEAGQELRHDAELRQEERLANEQGRRQVVNQGMNTGTQSSSHQGVDWGPSYRMLKQPHPTKSDIEGRAYEIYLERGCEHGRDLEDWLIAERELKPR